MLKPPPGLTKAVGEIVDLGDLGFLLSLLLVSLWSTVDYERSELDALGNSAHITPQTNREMEEGGIITPSTKLMTLFRWRRIGRGVRESSSSPTWA